jgi:hypothetical protein
MHHDSDIEELRRECAKAQSFEELADIAVREMEKFSESEIVCGPVTTGGLGSVEKNIQVFAAVIDMLKKEGRPIFNQEPYEERIAELKKRWRAEDPARAEAYCMPILDVLYTRIFDAGRVRKGWFIPGWESSFGSRWEHDKLKKMGVEIDYISPEKVKELV